MSSWRRPFSGRVVGYWDKGDDLRYGKLMLDDERSNDGLEFGGIVSSPPSFRNNVFNERMGL